MASQKLVNETLAILSAAYPSTAKADREAMREFMILAAQALAPYPEDVLRKLVNPRVGIIAECAFFPSIAELRKFCDRAWEKIAPVRGGSYDPPPPAIEFSEEIRAQNRAKISKLFKELSNTLKSNGNGRI